MAIVQDLFSPEILTKIATTNWNRFTGSAHLARVLAACRAGRLIEELERDKVRVNEAYWRSFAAAVDELKPAEIEDPAKQKMLAHLLVGHCRGSYPVLIENYIQLCSLEDWFRLAYGPIPQIEGALPVTLVDLLGNFDTGFRGVIQDSLCFNSDKVLIDCVRKDIPAIYAAHRVNGRWRLLSSLFESREEAIVALIAAQAEGNDGHAAYYFWKMLAPDEE